MPTFNASRLHRDFERLSSIGQKEDGSIHRLALSPEDREARILFIDLLHEAGMDVRIDEFGNIWGRTQGRWDEPAVITGSHLDSIPRAGRFDGVVGVVAALEAARALHESGEDLPIPLGVVNFTAEESARYGVATIGSKGVAGVLPRDQVEGLRGG